MYGMHRYCMPCTVHLSATADGDARVLSRPERAVRWSVSQRGGSMYSVHHCSMPCAVHLSTASATTVRAASRRDLRGLVSRFHPMHGVSAGRHVPRTLHL